MSTLAIQQILGDVSGCARPANNFRSGDYSRHIAPTSVVE